MNMRFLILLATVSWVWPWLALGRDDGGPQYKAPPEIVATLPKICWWLYMDNVPNTSEFNILDCGAYSNHYCPGLVHLKQAEQEKSLGAKLERLRRAKQDMEYTLHFTENYPECTIRQPAKANLERIKFQMDMLQWNAKKR